VIVQPSHAIMIGESASKWWYIVAIMIRESAYKVWRIAYDSNMADTSPKNINGGCRDSIEAHPCDEEAQCVEYDETVDGFSLEFTVKHEGPMTRADAVRYTVAVCSKKFRVEYKVFADVEVEIQDE